MAKLIRNPKNIASMGIFGGFLEEIGKCEIYESGEYYRIKSDKNLVNYLEECFVDRYF